MRHIYSSSVTMNSALKACRSRQRIPLSPPISEASQQRGLFGGLLDEPVIGAVEAAGP